MWKQTRSTAWSTIVNRATYWTLPLALAGAQEISQTWALSQIWWFWILVYMQRVTDSNPSASNCTSACPSQDSFSKFRPQADLTIAPTKSKNTMIMTLINLTHDISCLVQPATSAWNRARSFGSILETFLASQARALPVALLIGHIFNNSKNTKNISQIKFYLAATARWKTLTMTMVATRLLRRRVPWSSTWRCLLIRLNQ